MATAREANLVGNFFVPHAEAAALIAGKPAVPKRVFYGLLPELRARAFTVSGLETLGQLERAQNLIEDFVRGQTEDGEAVTWDDARKGIVELLGWDDAEAAERRATVLLRAQGFTAYQAANWRSSQQDSNTTHLQYLATEDSHVRPTHLALNGLILPKDDPFWQAHFPPWEWGCRCRTRSISPDLLEREREADAGRIPEARHVIEGAALRRLRTEGKLARGPIRLPDGRQTPAADYDVRAPRDKGGGEDAWQWQPGDLRLSLDELEVRYGAERFGAFREWARGTVLGDGQTTVWNWLSGSPAPR